jgi:hypothetical protein
MHRWWLHPRREHRVRQLAQDQVLNLDKEVGYRDEQIEDLLAEVGRLQRPCVKVRVAIHGQNVLDTGFVHPRTSWQGAVGTAGFLSLTWYPEEPADEPS